MGLHELSVTPASIIDALQLVYTAGWANPPVAGTGLGRLDGY